METNRRTKFIKLVFTLMCVSALAGCDLTDPVESDELQTYMRENGYKNGQGNLGQARFLMEGFASLNLKSLNQARIIPTKLYGTALVLAEEADGFKQDVPDVYAIMQKYGFVMASDFGNWDESLSKKPILKSPVGYVSGYIDGKLLGQNLKVQVSNISCAACHSGVEYRSDGSPSSIVRLGAAGRSVFYDAYLNQIYRGLVIGAKNPESLLAKIKQVYPQIDEAELKTYKKFLLPKVAKEVKKYEGMGRALPFSNGGPGMTNGVAAFKRDAHLFSSNYEFQKEENGFMMVPGLSDRAFKSSLTIDGSYGAVGYPRFFYVNESYAKTKEHLNKLASIAAFFTFSFGNQVESIESFIPKAQEIFSWLVKQRPQRIPVGLDEDKVQAGYDLYQQKCATCHGSYDRRGDEFRLTGFPNLYVPQEEMGSDSRRWQRATPDMRKFAEKNVISKYINAGVEMGGYVAPILTGIWTKAPYMHNGSVPTLWHFFHPEERPQKFEMGGHAIDFEKVGLRLKQNEQDGVFYLDGPHRQMKTMIYDTTESGRNNRGHEAQLMDLSESDKNLLLEFLKAI